MAPTTMWERMLPWYKVRQQADEIERLRAENATYKHAFQTTAADRDRLKRLLNPDVEASLGAAATQSSASQVDENVEAFGPLWGRVANDYDELLGEGPLDQSRFEAALRYGGFSQFSMYDDPAIVEPIVDWQLATLATMGVDLASLPQDLVESEVMPAWTRVERDGRVLSIDFLRFLAYAHTIAGSYRESGQSEPRSIIEIGSGFGGLARILKLLYPEATIRLIDIASCLRVAEFYLAGSMPGARIRWGDADEGGAEELGGDFILVPAEDATAIEGRQFDLALNVWSFGEMPNTQIRAWFDLIQKKNATRRLFLLNHFMAPVALVPGNLASHARQYDWLRQLDPAWHIGQFEIDPAIERPPYVLHKHRGVMLMADRIGGDVELEAERQQAERAARRVHATDWVRGSLAFADSSHDDATHARRDFITRHGLAIDDDTELVLDQFQRRLTVWRPDTDGGLDGTFFRLWNDCRVNGDAVSRRLLRIWLRLHWRPTYLDADGQQVRSIFREELHYSLATDGTWREDPRLELPEWLRSRLAVLAPEPSPDTASGADQ